MLLEASQTMSCLFPSQWWGLRELVSLPAGLQQDTDLSGGEQEILLSLEGRKENVVMALGTHESGMGRRKEKERELEEGRVNSSVEPRPLSLQAPELAL